MTSSSQAIAHMHAIEHLPLAVLDALNEQIAVADEHGMILFVNQAWRASKCRIPCDVHLAVGDNYLDFCLQAAQKGNHEAQRFADSLHKVVAGLEQLADDELSQTGSAGLHWFSIRLQRLSVEPVRVLIVIEEITARKQAEAARVLDDQRRAELRRLESLGLLSRGIAHEFNNLLQVMLGNVALLRSGHIPADSAQRAVERIELAARSAVDIIQQVLSYAADGRLRVRPLDLNALLLDMSSALRAAAGANATLQLELADELPLIDAVATQIWQMVLNLIRNAGEAISSSAGTITLRTSVQQIHQHYLDSAYLAPDLPPGTYVLLQVIDTGSGIDESTRQHMFEPFFTTRVGGRGLGLATVFSIVRAHRGAVHVESRPGAGTTMTILFPPSRGGDPQY